MNKNELIQLIMDDDNLSRAEAVKEYNENIDISESLDIDNGDYLEPGNGWESSNFDGAW